MSVIVKGKKYEIDPDVEDFIRTLIQRITEHQHTILKLKDEYQKLKAKIDADNDKCNDIDDKTIIDAAKRCIRFDDCKRCPLDKNDCICTYTFAKFIEEHENLLKESEDNG